MNKKFFEIKYVNERKHSRVNNMKLTIIAKIRETRTRFVQPTRSECFFWALAGPYPTLRFGGACGLGARPLGLSFVFPAN